MKNLYDCGAVQSLGRLVIFLRESVLSIPEIVSKEARIITEELGGTYHIVCETEKYATMASKNLPGSSITVSAIHFTQNAQDNGGIEHLLQLSVGIEGTYHKEKADEIIGKITSRLGYQPTNTPAIPAGSFAFMS